jgi:hypothetical protein
MCTGVYDLWAGRPTESEMKINININTDLQQDERLLYTYYILVLFI